MCQFRSRPVVPCQSTASLDGRSRESRKKIAKLSNIRYAARDFLARNQIPYQWIDVETDVPTRELIVSTAGSLSNLPVVLFPDLSYLVGSSTLELAQKVGLHTQATRPSTTS